MTSNTEWRQLLKLILNIESINYNLPYDTMGFGVGSSEHVA